MYIHRTWALLAHAPTHTHTNNRPGISKDLRELVYWPRGSVCSILRTWSYPKMEINTATEDFTVKCSISYPLPVIPTLHFCMCSLAFPSSYKQPDIIKVNTQPTLIHIARSLRNCESSIVDTAYGSCCSFSCFSPLFFHLLFSFSLSLVWQPPLPVSSAQEFSSWVLRKLRRLKESLFSSRGLMMGL